MVFVRGRYKLVRVKGNERKGYREGGGGVEERRRIEIYISRYLYGFFGFFFGIIF